MFSIKELRRFFIKTTTIFLPFRAGARRKPRFFLFDVCRIRLSNPAETGRADDLLRSNRVQFPLLKKRSAGAKTQ